MYTLQEKATSIPISLKMLIFVLANKLTNKQTNRHKTITLSLAAHAHTRDKNKLLQGIYAVGLFSLHNNHM